MVNVKDIDFEELDRAVSSAIAQKRAEVTPMPQAPVLQSSDQPIANTPAPSPTYQSPTSSSPSVPVTSPNVVAPLPTIPVSAPISRPNTVDRPNTGRFLDMVHPSANMRNPAVSVPERAAPIQSFQMPQAKPAQNVTVVSQTTPRDEDFDINQIGNELNKTLGLTLNEPQDTPFIQDAKVEKRPLNAFMSGNESQATVPTVPGFVSEQPKNVDTPLPAELQSDLLSIEANEVTKESVDLVKDDNRFEEPEKSLAPKPEMIIQEAKADIATDAPVMPEKVIQSTATVAEKPAEPISNKLQVNSISQQYEEKPSAVSQASGAIYDVDSYHKAAAPIKKKSGWSWVLWTILLMIVSIGAGVAVYFFVLPQI